MKNIFLFLCVGLLTLNGFSQKKISSSKTLYSASALPKVDNLQVEIKNGKFQVNISEKGKTNDFLIIKVVDAAFDQSHHGDEIDVDSSRDVHDGFADVRRRSRW